MEKQWLLDPAADVAGIEGRSDEIAREQIGLNSGGGFESPRSAPGDAEWVMHTFQSRPDDSNCPGRYINDQDTRCGGAVHEIAEA